jgi:hypothetical protein
MELFIKVYFWLAALTFVLRAMVLGFGEYPRKIYKKTDTISTIIGVPFLVWAACLLW